MITFCNINELKAAKEALNNLKNEHPSVYQKLLEMVYLTRALNFKYHYMGSLLVDDQPESYTPDNVHESVLRLYQNEMQKLKDNADFHVVKKVLLKYKNAGYANICQLLFGMKPESLVGASHLR